MRCGRLGAGVAVLFLGLGGCSSDESAAAGKCTPGQSIACACTDGRSGAQQCQSDGTFAPCECNGSGGTAGQSTGGTAGQSTGGTAGQSTGGTSGAGGTSGDSLTGEWSKAFPADFEISALDVNDSGLLVVVGTSKEPVDFGNGPVGTSKKLWQERQLLIAGFDAKGQRQFAFAKDAGRINSQTLSIKTVKDRLIVSGLTTVVSKGSSTYSLIWPCGTAPSSIGVGAQFVVAVDQSGNCLWDHTYPAPGYSMFPTSVASAPDDSAYVTGTQKPTTLPTRRYLADGTASWEQPFGGSALGVNSSGHVLLANYNSLALPTGNVTGLFAMAELDATGGVVASKTWGKATYDSANLFVGMHVGAGDKVAVALRYTGAVDLGGGLLTSTSGGSSPSKLFALFGNGFSHSFSRSIDEPKSDSGGTNDSNSRAVTTSSKAIYTGEFWRSVDFGTGMLQAVGTGDFDFDVFVASYDFSGTPLVSRRFGGDGSDGVRAVTADASGAVYLAGWFSTSVDFGDAKHDNPPQDSGLPSAASFLVKLRP